MSSVDRLTEEDYDRFIEDLCSGVATDRTFDVVKKILTLHSVDVLGMAVDSRKYTVFHFIAENNMVELLTFILNYVRVNQFNPAVDQGDIMDHTPLFIAASLGHLKICKILIEYGSKALDVRTLDTGEVPLHVAISEKHVDVVSYLLKFTSVIVPRVRRRKRYKPIHLAAMVGSIRIAKILFDHGANIESKSHNRATPLLIAMKHAQYDFATFLVKKGANVTHIYVMQGFITALHCVGNCSELAELLIKKGASIQNPGCVRTAMSHALSGLHIDVLRVFLRHGALPDNNDLEITHAKQDNLHRSRNIVRLLLCYGVTFKNRSLQALDPAFVKNLRGFYNSRRLVASSRSLLFSPLDRVFLFELARCTAIRLPGVAFRLFRNIRSFVTFHGLFMADGFEFTGSSLWSGGYDFSWIFTRI